MSHQLEPVHLRHDEVGQDDRRAGTPSPRRAPGADRRRSGSASPASLASMRRTASPISAWSSTSSTRHAVGGGQRSGAGRSSGPRSSGPRSAALGTATPATRGSTRAGPMPVSGQHLLRPRPARCAARGMPYTTHVASSCANVRQPGAPEREQPLGAVAAHARQHDGRRRARGPCAARLVEEHVHARPVRLVRGLGRRSAARRSRAKHQVVVGAGHEHRAPARARRRRRAARTPRPVSHAEPLDEAGHELGVEVLHDEDRQLRRRAARPLSTVASASGPAGGGAERQQRGQAAVHGPRPPAAPASAPAAPGDQGPVERGRRRAAPRAACARRIRRRILRVRTGSPPCETCRRAEGRAPDGVERARAERVVDALQVALDRRGDDQDRAGRAPHDAARGLDAVHHGHDEVHQDQVGAVGARSARPPPAPSGGRPGELAVGLAREPGGAERLRRRAAGR